MAVTKGGSKRMKLDPPVSKSTSGRVVKTVPPAGAPVVMSKQLEQQEKKKQQQDMLQQQQLKKTAQSTKSSAGKTLGRSAPPAAAAATRPVKTTAKIATTPSASAKDLAARRVPGQIPTQPQSLVRRSTESRPSELPTTQGTTATSTRRTPAAKLDVAGVAKATPATSKALNGRPESRPKAELKGVAAARSSNGSSSKDITKKLVEPQSSGQRHNGTSTTKAAQPRRRVSRLAVSGPEAEALDTGTSTASSSRREGLRSASHSEEEEEAALASRRPSRRQAQLSRQARGDTDSDGEPREVEDSRDLASPEVPNNNNKKDKRLAARSGDKVKRNNNSSNNNNDGDEDVEYDDDGEEEDEYYDEYIEEEEEEEEDEEDEEEQEGAEENDDLDEDLEDEDDADLEEYEDEYEDDDPEDPEEYEDEDMEDARPTTLQRQPRPKAARLVPAAEVGLEKSLRKIRRSDRTPTTMEPIQNAKAKVNARGQGKTAAATAAFEHEGLEDEEEEEEEEVDDEDALEDEEEEEDDDDDDDDEIHNSKADGGGSGRMTKMKMKTKSASSNAANSGNSIGKRRAEVQEKPAKGRQQWRTVRVVRRPVQQPKQNATAEANTEGEAATDAQTQKAQLQKATTASTSTTTTTTTTSPPRTEAPRPKMALLRPADAVAAARALNNNSNNNSSNSSNNKSNNKSNNYSDNLLPPNAAAASATLVSNSRLLSASAVASATVVRGRGAINEHRVGGGGEFSFSQALSALRVSRPVARLKANAESLEEESRGGSRSSLDLKPAQTLRKLSIRSREDVEQARALRGPPKPPGPFLALYMPPALRQQKEELALWKKQKVQANSRVEWDEFGSLKAAPMPPQPNVRQLARKMEPLLEKHGKSCFNPLQKDLNTEVNEAGIEAECKDDDSDWIVAGRARAGEMHDLDAPLCAGPGIKALPVLRNGRYQFEIELLKPCAIVVGWSVATTLPLAFDGHSFGLSSTGDLTVAHWDATSEGPYCTPFGKTGDVIACLVDWVQSEELPDVVAPRLSFALNGRFLGLAFDLLEAAEGSKASFPPLQPHVCQGFGSAFRVRLRGATDEAPLKYPANGFKPLAEATEEDFCPFSRAVALSSELKVGMALSDDHLWSFQVPDENLLELKLPTELVAELDEEVEEEDDEDAGHWALTEFVVTELDIVPDEDEGLPLAVCRCGRDTALVAFRLRAYASRCLELFGDAAKASELPFLAKPLSQASSETMHQLGEWRGGTALRAPGQAPTIARRLIHGCLGVAMPLSHVSQERHVRTAAAETKQRQRDLRAETQEKVKAVAVAATVRRATTLTAGPGLGPTAPGAGLAVRALGSLMLGKLGSSGPTGSSTAGKLESSGPSGSSTAGKLENPGPSGPSTAGGKLENSAPGSPSPTLSAAATVAAAAAAATAAAAAAADVIAASAAAASDVGPKEDEEEGREAKGLKRVALEPAETVAAKKRVVLKGNNDDDAGAKVAEGNSQEKDESDDDDEEPSKLRSFARPGPGPERPQLRRAPTSASSSSNLRSSITKRPRTGGLAARVFGDLSRQARG